MKKILMVLGILGVGSLSIPLTGMAAQEGPVTSTAETPAKLTSDVTVNVTAGVLSLDEVCDFSFSTSVKDISTGMANDLTEQTPTDKSVVVSDYRGNKDDSWKLTAALTSLTIGNDAAMNLGNAQLNLTGEVTNVSQTNEAALNLAFNNKAKLDITNTPIQILGISDGNGSGSTTINYNGATLTIPQADVYAGKYTGTITWTLTNSYTAE
jgi:hypothetical protein